MNSNLNIFQQAQLAEAAYANFINPDTGSIFTTNAGIQAALIASGFSSNQASPAQSAQAAAFITQWRVESQYTAPFAAGFWGTGFSGTLFQNIQTGEYALSIRGTNDVVADFLGHHSGSGLAFCPPQQSPCCPATPTACRAQ